MPHLASGISHFAFSTSRFASGISHFSLRPSHFSFAPSHSSRVRVRSLDLYRGVAVLLMVVAHVCDAFLADRWRDGSLWYALDITFGFVAPAFLFLSGAGVGLSLARREDARAHEAQSADSTSLFPLEPATTAAPPASISHPLRIRQRDKRGLASRLALILALAYWLQIPVLSLRQLVWNHRPAELARMFDLNILHVVAITGLLLVGLSTTGLSARAVRAVTLALAIITAAIAPWAWHSGVASDVWLPLRAFVGPQPAATFPLLPFAAYALLGFVAAPLVAWPTRRSLLTLIVVGIALLGGGLAIDMLASLPAPHDDFWHGSIQHTVFRLGGVVAALGALALAASRLAPHVRASESAANGVFEPPRNVTQRATLLERIGRRSLAIYVLHLIIVYGSPMTMGARYWFDGVFDRSLDPVVVAALTIVVAAVSCSASLVWPVLRERAPLVSSVLWWGWWMVFALLFLLTP
jgi:uncharacterized membrane protein